jgi:hypothetical protein
MYTNKQMKNLFKATEVPRKESRKNGNTKFPESHQRNIRINIKRQQTSRRDNKFDDLFEPTTVRTLVTIANLEEMVNELSDDLEPGPEYKVNPEPEVIATPEEVIPTSEEVIATPEPSNATYAPGWSPKDRKMDLNRELWELENRKMNLIRELWELESAE